MNEVIEIKLRNCRTNEKILLLLIVIIMLNQLLKTALKILVIFGG